MPIKIISGVLFPTLDDRSIGSAKISLTNGQLLPGSGALFKEVNVIGTGDFVGTPCVQVSLRHITVKDSPKKSLFAGGSELAKDLSFNLNDDFSGENGVKTVMNVSWAASPREEGAARIAEVMEISVLVIGETK